MATICTVIGQETQKPQGKPIEFIKKITHTIIDTTLKADTSMYSWTHIELIARRFNNDYYDLMYAYSHHRSNGYLFLGYWNDGFVAG